MVENGSIKQKLGFAESTVLPNLGRGMLLIDSTPVRDVGTVGRPALSSTHMQHDTFTPRRLKITSDEDIVAASSL